MVESEAAIIPLEEKRTSTMKGVFVVDMSIVLYRRVKCQLIPINA
jgi:hypothetical protein